MSDCFNLVQVYGKGNHHIAILISTVPYLPELCLIVRGSRIVPRDVLLLEKAQRKKSGERICVKIYSLHRRNTGEQSQQRRKLHDQVKYYKSNSVPKQEKIQITLLTQEQHLHA